MAKYMVTASYSADGVKGLINEGGTNRHKMVEEMMKNLGGKMESFYYAFGSFDVVAIVDGPDAITAAAISMAINSTGMVALSTVPLLTPADIDKAAKKSVGYRAPGT